MARRFNILVLGTGNTGRSILAEALFGHHGGGRVRAFSAGSRPAGAVDPLVVEILEKHGIVAPELRSKSWDEFAAPAGPAIDFVFTVCAPAAGESCPAWQGKPLALRWPIPDPASVVPAAARREAFERARAQLDQRVRAFLAMDLFTMSKKDIAIAAQMIHEACG